MDQTIILQARERSAQSKISNGDWQTVLTNPVILEEGDQVSIKTAVLDTTNQLPDSIQLLEDEQLTVAGIPYVCHFGTGYFNQAHGNTSVVLDTTGTTGSYEGSADPQRFNYKVRRSQGVQDGAVTDRSYVSPDFKRYYACQATNFAQSTGGTITHFRFKAGHKYLDQATHFTVHYTDARTGLPAAPTYYIEPRPGRESFSFNAKEIKQGSISKIVFDITKGITVSVERSKAVKFESFTRGNDITFQQGNAVAKPVLFSKTFTVPAGTYSCNEICEVINRAMTKDSTEGVSRSATRSNFFGTTDQGLGILRDQLTVTVSGTASGYKAGDLFTFPAPPIPNSRAAVIKVKDGLTGQPSSKTDFDVVDCGYGYTTFDVYEATYNGGTGSGLTVTNNVNNGVNAVQTLQFVSEFNAGSTSSNDDCELKVLELANGGANQAANAGNMLIGASQVELAYDEETKTFLWKYLFTPLYSGNPPNESVQVLSYKYKERNNPTGSVLFEGNHGICAGICGVALTQMTSLKQLSNQGNFWQDVLGFDGSNLLQYAIGAVDNKGTNKTQYFTMVDDLQEENNPVGKYITESFVGSDALYQKTLTGVTGDNENAVPWKTPTTDIYHFYSTVSSDSTSSIHADHPISDLNSDKSGYFLIDIDAITQSLVGDQDTKSTIQAVASRYYNSGSYTTVDDSSAIVYTHKGAVQLLQSLRCRILDPEGDVSTELGDDSAIFLQVLKASPAKPKRKA